MKEYRAQLDADRAERLSKGTNHANLRVKADDMKSKVRRVSSDHPVPQPLRASHRCNRAQFSGAYCLHQQLMSLSGWVQKRKKEKRKGKEKDKEKKKKHKKDSKEMKSSKSRKKVDTEDHSTDSSDSGDPQNGKSDGPVRLSDFLQGK